jgi:Mor family transcriptional regulator
MRIEIEDLPSKNLRLIADVIGTDGLAKLIEAVGGMTIYFPKTLGPAVLRKQLDAVKGNKSVNELSRELGVSTKTVYNILNSPRPKPPPEVKDPDNRLYFVSA